MTKEEALSKISENVDAFENMTEFYDDKEVVLEAVKHSDCALSYASEELRANKTVVLEAVKSAGLALQDASEELRADKEVVIEAVKSYKGALEFASKKLRADREVVLEAVNRSYYALQFASEELKNDKKVILEARKSYASNLAYASRDFLESATQELSYTLLSEVENVPNNTEILLIAIAENIQIRSAKINGVVIENHFGIVHIVDQSGEREIMLDSDKLKHLQKMYLDELVVFKVKITNRDSFKSINVSGIMTIDEVKELSK